MLIPVIIIAGIIITIYCATHPYKVADDYTHAATRYNSCDYPTMTVSEYDKLNLYEKRAYVALRCLQLPGGYYSGVIRKGLHKGTADGVKRLIATLNDAIHHYEERMTLLLGPAFGEVVMAGVNIEQLLKETSK